jgi:hypothetical protein
MRCRNCGTDIADKALICFRCGTATTEAKHQPAAPPRSSRAGLVATGLALALLVGLALYMGRAPSGQMPRGVAWVGVGLAVLVVGLRAWARRR